MDLLIRKDRIEYLDGDERATRRFRTTIPARFRSESGSMKPLAITLGDPAGIGSEIVFRAIEEIDPSIPLCLFGDWSYARQALSLSRLTPDSFELWKPEELTEGDLPHRTFVDISLADDQPLRFGTIDAHYGRVALRSIDLAVDSVLAGRCSALVTAPIHKQAIAAAGSLWPGHTEILAAKSGLQRYGEDYAMFFDSPTLAAVLLSVHLPLLDAIAQIDADRIEALAALTDREYRRLFGRAPSIGVAGVNPHAGEGGMFGDEENRIRDGVERSLRRGLKISGPRSADTIFRSAMNGDLDVVMAMYHDQALIPIKTVAFDRSVNVTLGLPYLRCSVDHGTAFDIAGRGIANVRPMRYAIEWAARRSGKESSL